MQPPRDRQSASGQYFTTASASVELQHNLNDATACVRPWPGERSKLLSALDSLPTYSTLGPMESGEATLGFGNATVLKFRPVTV